MGLRAVPQTSPTRQTSSGAARDDAKLCLRNPKLQPTWFGWRKESSSVTFGTQTGCFTVLGLRDPSGAAVQWGQCSPRGDSLGSPSLLISLPLPAAFLAEGGIFGPSCRAGMGIGSQRARSGGMEGADSCGLCKRAAVALPGARRASKAGIWLSLLAEVLLRNGSDLQPAFQLPPPRPEHEVSLESEVCGTHPAPR